MTVEEKTVGGVVFLAARGLGTPHGFSTRLGGVSRGIFESLNLGLRRGDEPEAVRENYRRFCAAIGADPARLATANQVHGTAVRRVEAEDVKGDLLDPVDYEADGLTTDVPGVALTIFTADCVPILLFDPVRRAVGAVHAGWRGTAGAIGAKGVAAMAERYGSAPEDLRAAIGPAIGPCCFETNADVPRALVGALGPWAEGYISPRGEKFFIDLKGLDREILLRAGLRAEHVAVSGDCTCCQPRRYWSHRYTHGERGSQAAMIYLPEGG